MGSKFCFEARCVFGPAACSHRTARATFFIIMTTIMIALAAACLAKALIVAYRMSKAGRLSCNAMSVSLVFNVISTGL